MSTPTFQTCDVAFDLYGNVHVLLDASVYSNFVTGTNEHGLEVTYILPTQRITS